MKSTYGYRDVDIMIESKTLFNFTSKNRHTNIKTGFNIFFSSFLFSNYNSSYLKINIYYVQGFGSIIKMVDIFVSICKNFANVKEKRALQLKIQIYRKICTDCHHVLCNCLSPGGSDKE